MGDTTKTYIPRQSHGSVAMPGGVLEFAREFTGKFSRRLSRMVPFRPFNLKLERPVVSFTFDDFACSAAMYAAPALEDAGMRGTFYYAGGLAGLLENGQEIARPDMAADLFSRGHEIGAHTHMHIDVHRTSSRTILEDLEVNKRQIAELTDGRAPTSFAYPFGRLDLRSKFLLRQEFGSLRGIKTGINSGIIDLAHLKAQELYDCSSTLESMSGLLGGRRLLPENVSSALETETWLPFADGSPDDPSWVVSISVRIDGLDEFPLWLLLPMPVATKIAEEIEAAMAPGEPSKPAAGQQQHSAASRAQSAQPAQPSTPSMAAAAACSQRTVGPPCAMCGKVSKIRILRW